MQPIFPKHEVWRQNQKCITSIFGKPTRSWSTTTEEQRQEFAVLVDETVRRIEPGLFLPHSGIRFPQNPCATCPSLCLDKRELVEAALVRKSGVDLGLFDARSLRP